MLQLIIDFRRPASGLALPLSDGTGAVGGPANQQRQKSVDTMDPMTIAEAKALQRQQAMTAPNLLQQAARLEKRANSVTNRTQVKKNYDCRFLVDIEFLIFAVLNGKTIIFISRSFWQKHRTPW